MVSYLRDTDGRTPESQRINTETSRDRENVKKPHLYYFSSEQNPKIQSVNAGASEAALRQCLGLKHFEQITQFFRTAEQVQLNHFSFYAMVKRQSTQEMHYVSLLKDGPAPIWKCNVLSQRLNLKVSQLSSTIPYPSESSSPSFTSFFDFSGAWFRHALLDKENISYLNQSENLTGEGFFDLAHFQMDPTSATSLQSFWMSGRTLMATDTKNYLPTKSPYRVELPLFIPIGAGSASRFFQVGWSSSKANSSEANGSELKATLLFNSNLMTEPGMRVININSESGKFESLLKLQQEWDSECRLISISTTSLNTSSNMIYYCDRKDAWTMEFFAL
jgi:hypothetical protein